MMKSFRDSIQKGSMMVEALALLGLITMVTPILYKKAAERTTELQDINMATQMRMLSTAVDDYIGDNYKTMGDTHPEGASILGAADVAKLEAYLPHGFNLSNSKMFKDFRVAVKKSTITDSNGQERSAFTSAVLAPLKDNLTIMRTSKIASMIGANGGVYRAATGKMDGTQGTWQAALTDFGFDAGSGADALKDGSLVVLSNEVIDAAKGGVSPDDVLFRVDDGDTDKNTMRTILYMGGNQIRDVTNIIAAGGSGGTVTIGKDADEPSNLFVTGATNLAGLLTAQTGIIVTSGGITVDSGDITASSGDLKISGDGTFGGDLWVAGTGYFGGQLTANSGLVVNNGSTLNGGVTISGAITQSGGDVSLSGGTFNATFDNITMNGKNTDIIGSDALKLTGGSITMSGSDINVNATNKVNIVGNSGVKIQAGTNYVDINPTNGTTVNGDLIVQSGNLILGSGTLTADHIVANVDLKVGSGCVLNSAGLITCKEMNIGELGAYANASGLSVGQPMANTSGHKLRVEKNGTAFIGYSYAAPDTNAHKGLLVDSTQADLRMGHARLVLENNATAANAWAMVGADTARLHAQNGTVYIGVGDWRNEDTRVYTTASEAGMKTSSSSLYMTSGGALKFATGNSGSSTVGIVADQYGISFGSGIGDSALASTGEGAIITGSGRTVAISRSGVLEVRNEEGVGEGHNSGFIRANRMVSHKDFPKAAAFHGGSGYTPSTKYDKYQVNPAYTSVMNDIKLATRGGARLSDILPDYINKGVYIADNTYKESDMNWTRTEGFSVVGGRLKYDQEPGLCGTETSIDSNCVASPWLGFLPTAQCPPMYARAVSVTPMKWRMAEVYTVQGIESLSSADLKSVLAGSSVNGLTFDNVFVRPTNPRNARPLWGTATSEGADHTHNVIGGFPVTFQANTWLNTTMFPIGSGSEFKGWHIVMGFLYWKNHFGAILEELGTGNDIAWNVFPTFAGEMAAVANMYCVFDRFHLGSGGRTWLWGENSEGSPVYQYDQLNNYRAGYSKGSDWSSTVNDPTLGYDDVW